MRLLSVISVTAFGMGACGGPTGGVALLKESVESIGNEMMTLHEPKRGVEYHDRSGKPFWVAFIPPNTDIQTLGAAGIPADDLRQCRQTGLTAVAIGQSDRAECATLPQLSLPELRVLHKAAGEAVQMTLALDAKGYRLADVR